MESSDADGLYRNRLLSGYMYARQQKAESSSSCIHRHSDCNADKRADFSFHTSDLLTGKVERLLQILIAEMWLAIYAAGRIGDIEVFAAQLIQVWCLGGLSRRLCSLACLSPFTEDELRESVVFTLGEEFKGQAEAIPIQ